MTEKNLGFYLAMGILLALSVLAFPVPAAIITEYLNTNLPGSDYQTLDIAAKEGCAIACLNDNRCQAATWVNRAGQAPACQLKDAVPSKIPVAGSAALVMHSYIKNEVILTTSTTPVCDVKAGFTADTTTGPAPLTVHFTDTSTGVAETVWNWGDGTQEYAAPGADVEHTFTSPGTYRVNLTVSDTSGISCASKTILVTGATAAQYNTLRVDTVPEGATLFIDGSRVGTTPVRLEVSLASGVHHIRLSMPGYQEYTDDVTLNPGQMFDLKVMLTKSSGGGAPSYTYQPTVTAGVTARTTEGSDLKKALKELNSAVTASGNAAAGTGILTVTSNPAGANVYLDGRSEGTTPLSIHDIATGQHTLLLTQQGYAEASRTVNISAGSENLVAVEMSTAKKTPGFAAAAGILCIALLVLNRKRIG